MAYGVGTVVEKLVWGNVRPSAPVVVATALDTATDMINDALNIREELTGTDLPPRFAKIAELFAAGIIQEQRKPEAKSQNTMRAEKLLDGFKDESSELSRGESFHLVISDNE